MPDEAPLPHVGQPQTDGPTAPAHASMRRWGKWLGVGAFSFFLIKGLCWLTIPAVLAWWATNR